MTSMTTSLFERGLYLMPVSKRGKCAFLPDWPNKGVNSVAALYGSFAGSFGEVYYTPRLHELGVVIQEGNFVIDIDSYKDAETTPEMSLYEMKRYFDVSQTFIVRSQSGGYHIYLRTEQESIAKVSCGKFMRKYPYIEFKRRGHYVKAPVCKGYEVVNDAVIAEVDTKLLEPFFVPPRSKASIPKNCGLPYLQACMNGALDSLRKEMGEGNSHFPLLRFGSSLGRTSLSEEFICELAEDILKEKGLGSLDEFNRRGTIIDGVRHVRG